VLSRAVGSQHLPLILDLSLIQTLDYYTGIVFEVVSDIEAQTRILGQVVAMTTVRLYHHNIPGIGFALNIEDLQQVLLFTNQLPKHSPASNCWLYQRTFAYAAAFAYAENSEIPRI